MKKIQVNIHFECSHANNKNGQIYSFEMNGYINGL